MLKFLHVYIKTHARTTYNWIVHLMWCRKLTCAIHCQWNIWKSANCSWNQFHFIMCGLLSWNKISLMKHDGHKEVLMIYKEKSLYMTYMSWKILLSLVVLATTKWTHLTPLQIHCSPPLVCISWQFGSRIFCSLLPNLSPCQRVKDVNCLTIWCSDSFPWSKDGVLWLRWGTITDAINGMFVGWC